MKRLGKALVVIVTGAWLLFLAGLIFQAHVEGPRTVDTRKRNALVGAVAGGTGGAVLYAILGGVGIATGGVGLGIGLLGMAAAGMLAGGVAGYATGDRSVTLQVTLLLSPWVMGITAVLGLAVVWLGLVELRRFVVDVRRKPQPPAESQ